MAGNRPAEVAGARAFLETLQNFNVGGFWGRGPVGFGRCSRELAPCRGDFACRCRRQRYLLTNPPSKKTPPQVPVALATPLPERRVTSDLDRLGLARAFAAVITAEDNASPELENSYLAASHQLQRPPLRCVVLGDSNRSVEAAHELGMKSVVVTGGQPAWEFSAADLVVRGLGQLTFVNLKKLFSQEDLVEPHTPWEEIQASQKQQREEEGEVDEFGLGAIPSFDFGSSSRGSRRGGGNSGSSSDGGDASAATSWRSGSPDGDLELAGSSSVGSKESLSSSSWAPRLKSSSRSSRSSGGSGSSAGGGSVEREKELATASASAPPSYQGGESDMEASDPMGLEDEEDFEVVMPPKGAAFWDLK
jgi:beta-phosphoglucomutase-like phosphatase (HAD superfamily)